MNVPKCQVQVYVDDVGKWWRYCFTCDDGSNKYGKHLRGHRTEKDARMSERDHVRDKRKAREAIARFIDWKARLLAASTPEEFEPVIIERFPEFDWHRGRGVHPWNVRGSMRVAHEVYGQKSITTEGE